MYISVELHNVVTFPATTRVKALAQEHVGKLGTIQKIRLKLENDQQNCHLAELSLPLYQWISYNFMPRANTIQLGMSFSQS